MYFFVVVFCIEYDFGDVGKMDDGVVFFGDDELFELIDVFEIGVCDEVYVYY